MWAAILPALVSAITTEGVHAGFNALSGDKGSKTTTPVQPPALEQPDILGQLMSLMQNKGRTF